jgi:hypothetical protein
VNPGDTISGEMKQNRWGFSVVFREASKGEIPSPFLVFSYYPLPNSTKFHGWVPWGFNRLASDVVFGY